MLVAVAIIIFNVFAPEENDVQEPANQIQTARDAGLALATLNKGDRSDITIAFFANIIDALMLEYPNRSYKDLTNGMVAGHNAMVQAGKPVSLAEFVSEFYDYSKEIDNNHDLSLEDALTFFVKIMVNQ